MKFYGFSGVPVTAWNGVKFAGRWLHGQWIIKSINNIHGALMYIISFPIIIATF